MQFLRDFEVIPVEHRVQLWMNVILCLPNNKVDYIILREKGKKLQRNNLDICKGCDATKKKHLRVFSSLLAHCPSLERLEGFDVGEFLEPFCNLLSKHELALFEVVLTVIGNFYVI